MIDKIITPDSITPETGMILANAVYFEAKWQLQFERELTETKPFTMLDGEKFDIPLMFSEESLRYAEIDGVQCVMKYYDNPDYAMVVMLPPEGKQAWEKFETEQFGPKLISSMYTTTESRLARLWMPRFQLGTEIKLTDDLKALGMRDAFDWPAADFGGINKDFYLQFVLHKAVLRVNEKKQSPPQSP